MKTVGLASPKSKKPKKCPKQPRSQKSLKMALGRALCILQNFEEVQKKRGVPIKNKHWRAQLARSLRSPMLVFYESHPPFFLYLFKILENAVPCLFKQIFWGQGECHRRRKIFWRLLLLLLKP